MVIVAAIEAARMRRAGPFGFIVTVRQSTRRR
jgi:hypothetical protein